MKTLIFTLFVLFLTFCVRGQGNEAEIFGQARQNIEKYRKANFSLQVEGTSLKGITIDVEQTGHEFLFGCIAFDLTDQADRRADPEKFRERFRYLLNSVNCLPKAEN